MGLYITCISLYNLIIIYETVNPVLVPSLWNSEIWWWSFYSFWKA